MTLCVGSQQEGKREEKGSRLLEINKANTYRLQDMVTWQERVVHLDMLNFLLGDKTSVPSDPGPTSRSAQFSRSSNDCLKWWWRPLVRWRKTMPSDHESGSWSQRVQRESLWTETFDRCCWTHRWMVRLLWHRHALTYLAWWNDYYETDRQYHWIP